MTIREKILEALRDHPAGLTSKQFEELGFCKNTLHGTIWRMQQDGEVITGSAPSRSGKGNGYNIYKLAPDRMKFQLQEIWRRVA